MMQACFWKLKIYIGDVLSPKWAEIENLSGSQASRFKYRIVNRCLKSHRSNFTGLVYNATLFLAVEIYIQMRHWSQDGQTFYN
jgi:hypothetical protein